MKRLSLLFAIPALTLLPDQYSYSCQSQMVAEWQSGKTYTKAYLDAMPADGYVLNRRPRSVHLLNKCFIWRLTIMVSRH